MKTNRRGGFTLVEIAIVVAILALLCSIAVPNFLRARDLAAAAKIVEKEFLPKHMGVIQIIKYTNGVKLIQVNYIGADGKGHSALVLNGSITSIDGEPYKSTKHNP